MGSLHVNIRHDIKKIVLIQGILCILFFTACESTLDTQKSDVEKADTISFASFRQEPSTPQITNLNFGKIIDDIEIIDSLLFISDYTGDSLLKIVSLNSNKLIGSLVPRGKGQFQCLNIFRILPIPGTTSVYVFDVTLSKLVRVDYAKFLQNPESYRPETEIQFGNNDRGIFWLDIDSDSTFIATTYGRDDCRVIRINRNAEVIDKFGTLPSELKKWPSGKNKGLLSLHAIEYPAMLKKNSSNEKCALFYSTTDRMELYDKDSLLNVIRGPQLFDPVYKFENLDGYISPVSLPESRFAYCDVKAGNKYIFALYSGERDFKTAAARLLVYDWNGKPCLQLNLNESYARLAIKQLTTDSARIYLVNPETGDINFIDKKI